jgi:hypothetical protein
MLHLNPDRQLALKAPSSPGRPRYLSAASGLVEVGEYLYVVADDELQLGVFPTAGDAPGDLVRLFPGELPAAYQPRKAAKPDLEVLVRLPPLPGYTYGALLALGSGSTTNRTTGALIAIDAVGRIDGHASAIDLRGIYDPLALRFRTLNIEGAVITGNELVLLQRGNKHHAQCAYIHLDLTAVLQSLASTQSLGNAAPTTVRTYDLGEIDGVPLCFSDGAALPDGGVIFTAIAENSGNSYDDGPCAGAAIGITDPDGKLCYLERVEPGHKVEGIEAAVEDRVIRLKLVTDADDARIPAWLLTAEIRGFLPR